MPKQKILAINFKFIGDVAVCTTALKGVYRHFPEAEIHALVAAEAVPVLSSNPRIKRVWSLTRARGLRARLADIDTIRKVRAEDFDLSVDFGLGDRGAIVSRLVGARKRLGQFSGGSPRWRNWCYHTTIEALDINRHETVRCFHGLKPLGIDLPKDLSLEVHHNTRLNDRVPDVAKGAILVHCTASKQNKQWAIHHLVELNEIAKKRSLQLVFSGGPSKREQNHLRNLKSKIEESTVLPAVEELEEFIAILSQCKAIISMDTSILHLAAGLGKPTVGIFGSSSSHRWAPQGLAHTSVQGCHCTCSGHNASCDQQARCIDTILPDKVWEAFRSVCK